GADVLPLTPRQLEQKRREGALIVDVRTDFQFDDAHVPGSVSNTMLRSGFGTKLAWIAERDQEMVFVGRDDADGQDAAKLAVAVGIRRLGAQYVLHVVPGGVGTWERRGYPIENGG